MSGSSYRVTRRFFRDDVEPEVVASGLTLEEARAHCRDPETSSSSAVSASARAITEKLGPWFDGYDEEGPGEWVGDDEDDAGGITAEGVALGHRYTMGDVNAYCPKCSAEQGVCVLDCDYDLDK